MKAYWKIDDTIIAEFPSLDMAESDLASLLESRQESFELVMNDKVIIIQVKDIAVVPVAETNYEKSQYCDIEKLKEAVWQEWLDFVRCAKGLDSVNYLVKKYGFTGMFTGLEGHITKETLVNVLQKVLNE